jgi:isopentenyl-diphosphate delta-isomerase type 1
MTFRPANADELFDVVDLNDRVVGQAPRREVHAKNMIHRATHVLVHNSAGQIFLQKRSMSKDTYPGCWDSSCSGHLDAGEDYVTAARRELGEELGWHDTSLPLLPLVKLTPSPQNGYEFIQIFVMGPIAGPFVLHPEEISEGRWVTPSELDALVASPDQVAGALRFLWSHHRAEILAKIV